MSDVGIEGEDPDEVINITTKDKLDISTYKWVIKVRRSCLFRTARTRFLDLSWGRLPSVLSTDRLIETQKVHKFVLQSARALTLALYFAPVILTLPLYKMFPSFRDRWWQLLVKAIEVPSSST